MVIGGTYIMRTSYPYKKLKPAIRILVFDRMGIVVFMGKLNVLRSFASNLEITYI